MSTTCLICNSLYLEMISILRHPKGLDSMLRRLLGLKATEDDYICKTCCSDVINAFELRQIFHQVSFKTEGEATEDGIDSGDQIDNEISLSELDIVEEDFEDVNDGTSDVRCHGMLSKSRVKVEPCADSRYRPAQRNVGAVAGGGNDSTSLNETKSSLNVSGSKQTDSDSVIGCWEYFEREKSVDIDVDNHNDEEEVVVDIVEMVCNSELVGNTAFSCRVCNTLFTRILRFQEHMQEEHPEITIKNTLQLNMKREFVCQECGKSYKSLTNFRIHMTKHSGARPYKCSQCSKTFITFHHLKRHEFIHTGEKPFKCSYCIKMFKAAQALKIHERIHTGEKPYQCSYCSKAFRSSAQHLQHEMMHRNEKSYVCCVCGKGYYSSHYLNIHKRTHTGEKPYQCSYCPNAFISKTHRRNHEGTHRNEKLYVCSECGKDFTTSTSLKAHKSIHTGEKPYKCSYCSKAFRLARDSKLHEVIHTGDKPYVCFYCSKTFATKRRLRIHESRHHTDND